MGPRQGGRGGAGGGVTDAASFAVALPLGKEKVGTMSAETDAIEVADTELAHAMGRLLRAMDAAGDDGEAARYISERMPEALEELARRINAAQGLGS
jgi:hypothetical protein